MASILALPNLSPACASTLRDASEARLLALIAQGHEDAFGEIVERHEREIRAACARRVGLDHAADITQQAFLHALMALRRGGGPAEPEALRPWLFLIARNCCIDHLRARGPETVELTHVIDGVPQPSQIVEQRDQVRRTVDLLQVLPREQRRALVARELEGRSYDEISAELGATDGGVRQMIFRARSAVRRGVAALVPLPRLLLTLRGSESASALLSPHGDAVLGCLVIALSGCAPFVATGVADHVVDRGPVARHAPAPPRTQTRTSATTPAAATSFADTLPVTRRRVVTLPALAVDHHAAARPHRVAAPHRHRPATPAPAPPAGAPVVAPPATAAAPILASSAPAAAPAAAPVPTVSAPAATAPPLAPTPSAPASDESTTTGSSIDVPTPVSPGRGHGNGQPKGPPPGQAKKAPLPIRSAPAPEPPAPAAATQPPPAEPEPQASAPAPSGPAPGNGHGHGKGHDH